MMMEDAQGRQRLQADETPSTTTGRLNVVNVGVLSVLVQTLLVLLLVVKATPGETMTNQHPAWLTVSYIISIVRNGYFVSIVRDEHSVHSKFQWRALAKDGLCGGSSGHILELVGLAALGMAFMIAAFKHAASGSGADHFALLYASQAANFAVLFLLVLVVELGWKNLHVICLVQQVWQVTLIIYDVALHIATATDEDMGGDYRDFRLANLGTIITLRVLIFRFFKFKVNQL
jgi:hypothetical protein